MGVFFYFSKFLNFMHILM